MSKKYWTSLTSTYVPEWSAPEAVREVLQNFLDSPAEFQYDFGGDELEFINKGITLHQSTILMGSTTKRDELESVGGKGEGYKLACLVLLREGYEVSIANGCRVWTPAIEYNEDFEAECLVFNETSGSGSDLVFTISGVDTTLTEEIVDKCLYLQEDLGEVLEGERGRVLKDRSGKLYVGGLYVCDIAGYKWSYDFSPKYLPLNRDRRSVSSWDLASNVTKLLEEVMPAKELAQLVVDRAEDSGSYYSSFVSEDVAEEVYNNFKDKFGDTAVVAEDMDGHDKLDKRGYKTIGIVYNTNQRELIKKAPSYIQLLEELESSVDEEEPEDTRSPIEMLQDFYDDTDLFGAEDKFDTLLEVFKERGVSFDS